MGIDELKERFERLLAEYTRPVGARDQAQAMRAALVDLKVGLKDLVQALEASEAELARERSELETAERRSRLAADIADEETKQLADEYARKHGERVEVLVRKLAAQRDEITIANRDYEELSERYRTAKLGVPLDGPRPRVDLLDEDELLRAETDRQATEATVAAQLEALKRKLKRD